MTFTEFLLARIADDERVVRYASVNAHHPRIHLDADGHVVMDLRRMLAECEAKRRIVTLHPLPEVADVCGTCSGPGIEWWPCPTLRALALPYADHPDYDPSWAVIDAGEVGA